MNWFNKQCTLVTEEITVEITKHLELNENGNTSYENLWDVAKDMLRGKILASNVYFRKCRKA